MSATESTSTNWPPTVRRPFEVRIPAYIDRALATTRRIDRFYWLTAAVDVVLEQDDNQH